MKAADATRKMLDRLRASPMVELTLPHEPFPTPGLIIEQHEETFGARFPEDYRQFLMEFGACDIEWRFKERPKSQSPDVRIKFLPVPRRHPRAGEDEEYRSLFVVLDAWDLSLLCLRLQAGTPPQWVWDDVVEGSLSEMKLSFEDYVVRQAPFFFIELGPFAPASLKGLAPFELEPLMASVSL
jgi:hypothetical protein